MSFSELFDGVIADPYQLGIGDLAKCTETELRQKQAEIEQTAVSVGYSTAEMVAIVIGIIIDRRNGFIIVTKHNFYMNALIAFRRS